MINILSIDIDYAYAPLISAYDDDVQGSRICFNKQMELLNERGFDKGIVNYCLLEQVANILATCDRSTKYNIVEHHHEILSYLPKDKIYNIYNVDHHHDVSYGDWHDAGKLDEGNWVEYAFRKTQLKEYFWIRNSSSENLDNRFKREAIKEIFLPNNLQNGVSFFPKFDSIIFCSSPHWTFGSGGIIIDELITGWQDAEEIQTRQQGHGTRF